MDDVYYLEFKIIKMKGLKKLIMNSRLKGTVYSVSSSALACVEFRLYTQYTPEFSADLTNGIRYVYTHTSLLDERF